MNSYPVQEGESIVDVVMNATGSLSNWDAILTANGFDDWTPVLKAGQVIIIPSTVVVDPNSLRQLQQFPICNNSVNDILTKINEVFDTMNDNWILATGFWNDDAVWIDTDFWID
jgi:hypothetical protein